MLLLPHYEYDVVAFGNYSNSCELRTTDSLQEAITILSGYRRILVDAGYYRAFVFKVELHRNGFFDYAHKERYIQIN